MTRLTLNRALKTAPLIALGLLLPTAAQAQEAAPTPEYAMIFNTLLFLIGGFLVMWMAAGFAMLEMGLVRSKNVSMQGLKKHRPLFHRRHHVLAHWLQFDVYRC